MSRRLRELTNEEQIERQVIKGQVWYKAKQPQKAEILSEINKYAIALITTEGKEASDIYFGKMEAVHDIEDIIKKL